MMRKYVYSVGYALAGFRHVVLTERNFPWFLSAYVASLIVGYFLHLTLQEFAGTIFAGSIFLAVELLNTALERLADAFDQHARKQDDVNHHAIKLTKDIAAAASLMAILAWLAALVLIFWPHVLALKM